MEQSPPVVKKGPRKEKLTISKEIEPILSNKDLELLKELASKERKKSIVNDIIVLESSLLSKSFCSISDNESYKEAALGLPFLNGDKLQRELNNKDVEETSKRKFLSCAIEASTNFNDNITPIRFSDWLTNFTLIGEVSTQGIVIEASYPKPNSPKNLFILKVPKDPEEGLEDIYNEAMVGIYGLNRLKSVIPNFTYTYGYTLCNNVTKNPLGLCNKEGDIPYLIVENVKNNKTLYAVIRDLSQYSNKDIYNIILQVLNAIAFAEDKLNFTHYDLHWKNVLVSPIPTKMYIPCTLDNPDQNDRYIIAKNYLATIIDFGLSSFSYKNVSFGREDMTHALINRKPSSLFDTIKLFMFVIYTSRNIREEVEILFTKIIDDFMSYFVKEALKNGLDVSSIESLRTRDFFNIASYKGLPYSIPKKVKYIEEELYKKNSSITPYVMTKKFYETCNKYIYLDSFVFNRDDVDKNFIYNYDNNKLNAVQVSNIVTDDTYHFQSDIDIFDYINSINTSYSPGTPEYIKRIKELNIDYSKLLSTLSDTVQDLKSKNKDLEEDIIPNLQTFYKGMKDMNMEGFRNSLSSAERFYNTLYMVTLYIKDELFKKLRYIDFSIKNLILSLTTVPRKESNSLVPLISMMSNVYDTIINNIDIALKIILDMNFKTKGFLTPELNEVSTIGSTINKINSFVESIYSNKRY